MRLVQFRRDDGGRAVGVVADDGGTVTVLSGAESVYELAMSALDRIASLSDLVAERSSADTVDYDAIVSGRRLLPPLDHPDPARCLVSGTGLTHLGSADARDRMHKKVTDTGEQSLSDSMRMFKWGLEGGKPAAGTIGAQPEWFYKGNGTIVVPPGHPIPMPGFAKDGGEEPELAGLYVIAPDGTPVRVGFAIGNEFSDHVMERENYLYLAHSKLRACAYGPELLTGSAPADIRGVSRVIRDGTVLWEQTFLTGEANMSHSIANLEYHHFKYRQHRIPGDVHVHYFGTATLSFGDGIKALPGDVFEISAEVFGRPLRNPLAMADQGIPTVRPL